MGNFRIVINAVGSADNDRSPEAILKRAVDELKATGNSVTEATVHHWPGGGFDVVDNLLTGKRTGSF